MSTKPGMDTGVEVARISVKVSPDTSKFREELKRKLKEVENSAGADVGFGADTEKMKRQVRAASQGLSATVDVSAKKGSIDRFQRRTAAELAAGMTSLEANINLDRAGEQFRRDIERAEKALERLIKQPIPDDIGAAAARRQMIREELDALKKLAAEEKDNTQIEHQARLALWKDELHWMKLREEETRKFAKAHKEELEAEKKARLAPDDDWRKRSIAELRKAQQELEKKLESLDGGEKLIRDLRDKVKEIERDINVEIPVELELAESQRRKIKEQIEEIKSEVSDGEHASPGKGTADTKAFGMFSSFGGKLFSLPSFGSGVNPAGYLVILGAAIALAAPLIGLLSTAILSIPGLISAVATPFAAIALGMEGIKKAASASGLFKLNDKGEFDGLGSVFDPIKEQASKAFEEGLTKPFLALKDAVPDLLKSLPKVATGLTDMFKGFTDSITSEEGIGYFDKVVANLGAAMSASAPGVQSFTDGMLRLTAAFSEKFPGLATWFNRTGDSFDAWITKMTTPHDPAGAHGTAGQSSPLEDAFAGLGDTLRTIGEWAVELAKSGMEFAQDPQKMKDFVTTLQNIGNAISLLVDIGNDLGGAWAWATGPLLRVPHGREPNTGSSAAPGGSAQIGKTAEPSKPSSEEKGFWSSVLDAITGANAGSGGAMIVIGDRTVSGNSSSQDVAKVVKEETDRLNAEISVLEQAVKARTEGGFKQSSSDALENYKKDLAAAKAELDKVKEASRALQPEVALQSSEKPLAPPGGQKSDPIPAPDTSAFKTAMDGLAGVVSTAMAGATTAAAQGVQAITDSFRAAGNVIVSYVQRWPGDIAAALAPCYQIGLNAGTQISTGMANGIDAGRPFIIAAAQRAALSAKTSAEDALEIKSPSRVFMGIGENTAKGFGVGLEGGFQPVLEQAKDLAGKVSEAFANGGDPTAAIAGYSSADIDRIRKALELEGKILGNQAKALDYQAKTTGNDALKARADELRMQKDQLGLQEDMLDMTNDYNDAAGGGEDPFVKAASGLMKSPTDFAKATGQQFLSDIGISGDGLISKAITEGISYVFNIGSVDEALSIKDRETSKQALPIVGR